MKEAIRMVLESIYDPEFPDTSHSRSGRGCHSVLRRIKEEWGTSRWFLEFNIRKSFHTIDRYRLISIFKEEIDDPKFFYSIQKVFSAGRLVGDDLLLGIVGAVELLIEIQKRINHFLQSGLNLWVDSAGSTTIAARSTVEFLGTVIREVPPRTTPIQFLRELEKRLRVKHRIHITACHLRSAIHSKFRNLGNSIPIKQLTKGMSGTGSLLDAVQLAETLGTAGVRSPQVSVLWGTVKHIRQGSRGISLLHSSGRSKVPSDVQQAVSRSGTHARKLSLYTPAGRKAAGEGGGHWARSISSEFPIQMEAPIKKILRRLRDRGLISRRRPWPIHVACLTNVSDGDIVNWSAGIAISPLSYYRCRDNLYQVRTIVDHQIRWSAIFTPAHKHKSSARNIIPKYSKDSNRVNQEGGKTLAEFPNSIELGKLGSGQDPNNKEHSTTSLV
ncbi:UNVERIFIED_CONTAM: Group II intron-encoded protein LtrA [Sesamum angustifolium]|uniref:Group II intron-encoded protein LtrA n=1 Tax=Sesamum angustifolium TaxID=2727405 RepID=A0AAW2JJ68_9LAMI